MTDQPSEACLQRVQTCTINQRNHTVAIYDRRIHCPRAVAAHRTAQIFQSEGLPKIEPSTISCAVWHYICPFKR